MPSRWSIRRVVPPGCFPWRALAQAWNLPEAVARLAWLRGVDSPDDLAWRLDPSWGRTWDPFLLQGMGAAVARIRQAVDDHEPIVIYGDYDVDGVTATALMVRVLERLGAKVSFFIPDRFNDGYGLHLDCIQELAAKGAQLVISVDCGVRSLSEVAAGRELGLDWIITDHHAMGPELPAALVLHPALGDYPNPHLAGVGVAFKLGQALLDAVPTPTGADVGFLDGLLKLVALGTVADMVPLVGENALLVKRGLQALGGNHGAGLTALLQTSRISGVPRAQDLAFGPAPRLNAAGRMGGATDAVHLLLSRSGEEAQRLATDIDRQNEARKDVQRAVAAMLPEPDGSSFDLAIHGEAHKGVVGIVAAQRMRRTGLPTAVGTVIEGIVHCSLRAPDGYDCRALLDVARPFLRSGGGHKAAAGMTFLQRNTSFIRKALQAAAAEQAALRPPPCMAVDGAGWDWMPKVEDLLRLEPYGQGWPEPLTVVEGVLSAPPQPFGVGHARLRLGQAPGDIVWFFADGESLPGVNERLRCAVAPSDHVRYGRRWRLESWVGEEA